MGKIPLKNILNHILSKDELLYIPDNILEKILDLKEVNDINSFIKNCEKETVNFKIAGAHRRADWEKGWSGKGVYYSNDEYNNLPYYFKNNTHVRIGNKVFEDLQGFAEVDLLRSLQFYIFNRFLPNYNCSSICEYGCGTGSNISFLKGKFNKLNFYGTDWADSACEKLIENEILSKDKVGLTNFFEPSSYFSPSLKYIAFTNASLEQTGENYKQFMEYLFLNDLCIGGIHIEPIRELLNLTYDINKQSYSYAEKRGYLKNFYNYMNFNNSINIFKAYDYGIGSKYLNGYQVLCWIKK